MKDNKYLYFGYLLIIGLVFYLMNVFTPLFCDDWHYNFIYGTQTQIKTLGDVLYSQYLHYFSMNGRFVPHFFVQLFDGILGKGLFNVVNTFMFMAFIYLISYTLRKEYKSFYISSSLALFFIFFFIPAFNNCFLWMSGACNYLWVAVLLLSFNIVLEKDIKNKTLFPLLFVFGIICGWSNEATAFGLGAGYFVYYILNREKLSQSRVVALIGYYIGLALLVLAPGSVNRALGEGHITFEIGHTIHNMISSLIAMDDIRLFPFLVLIVLAFLFFKKERLNGFFKDNLAWLVAIVVSFIFVLWTRHGSGQSRFGFELFSLILILKLLSRIVTKRIIPTLCNVVVFVISVYVLHISYLNYKDYTNCLEQIARTKDGMVLTNTVKYPSYFERFLIFYTWAETMYVHSPYDNWIIQHFQKDNLCFIPQRLYNGIINNPEKYLTFDMETKEPYYVRLLENAEVNQVKLELYETNMNDLPFYIRPFANKLERYNTNEITGPKYDIIWINGKSYIIVNKHPMVDNRLKEIVVE